MTKEEKIQEMEDLLDHIVGELQCDLRNAYENFEYGIWSKGVQNAIRGCNEISSYLGDFIEEHENDEPDENIEEE